MQRSEVPEGVYFYQNKNQISYAIIRNQIINNHIFIYGSIDFGRDTDQFDGTRTRFTSSPTQIAEDILVKQSDLLRNKSLNAELVALQRDIKVQEDLLFRRPSLQRREQTYGVGGELTVIVVDQIPCLCALNAGLRNAVPADDILTRGGHLVQFTRLSIETFTERNLLKRAINRATISDGQGEGAYLVTIDIVRDIVSNLNF